MTDESVSAKAVIEAPVDVVFSALADPATHAAIDGTGRVRGPVDTSLLAAAGQVFRMAMYHEAHLDGDYETANRVEVFEPPTAISWETGYDPGDGRLRFGGWVWRYDLAPAGPSRTDVTCPTTGRRSRARSAGSSTSRPSTRTTSTSRSPASQRSSLPEAVHVRRGSRRQRAVLSVEPLSQ